MPDDLKPCPFCGSKPVQADEYLHRMTGHKNEAPWYCHKGCTMQMGRETWNNRVSANGGNDVG